MEISNPQTIPAARTDFGSSTSESAGLAASAELAPAASTHPLTLGDYRTLALAALGGALEFYDFIIFVLFAQALGQLFFPPGLPDWLRQLQTFGVFAVGFFVRPLGGLDGTLRRFVRTKADVHL
jgi:hypothetical protein